jgi:hypothetical protein
MFELFDGEFWNDLWTAFQKRNVRKSHALEKTVRGKRAFNWRALRHRKASRSLIAWLGSLLTESYCTSRGMVSFWEVMPGRCVVGPEID